MTFVLPPPVPSCIHLGVEEGCSQESCWLLPTWGGTGQGLDLLDAAKPAYPSRSQLSLFQDLSEEKREGVEIVKILLLCKKSVPNRNFHLPPTHRTVLDQVKVRCGREVEAQEPIVVLAQKDTLVSSVTATQKSSS